MRNKKSMSLFKLAKKGKKKGQKKQALEAMSKHELPPLPPPAAAPPDEPAPAETEVPSEGTWRLGEWLMRIGESKIPNMRQLFLLAASSYPTMASTLDSLIVQWHEPEQVITTFNRTFASAGASCLLLLSN